MRTRFAPSPTGDLHLGGALVALAAWLVARASGGRGGAGGDAATVLRVEDLDGPRVVPGAEARIAGDLRWLGLDWDESPSAGGPHGPYRQSERGAIYEGALAALAARSLVYPCDCSRAEILRVASAPHEGEEIVYPGTCRDRPPERAFKRPPSWRLRVPEGTTRAFVDRARGDVAQDVSSTVGDFVLRRSDGIFAYQLACAVDDAAMGVGLVVRGDDLLASTPRQLFLIELLGEGARAPAYLHVPLVRDADGERLAKRTPGATVRELREGGLPPARVLAVLAGSLGLADREAEIGLDELVARARVRPLTPTPLVVPADFARVASTSTSTA